MEAEYLRSPHLTFILKKKVAAGIFSTAVSDGLYREFLAAIQARGAEEIGFLRPEGQSFNPRAARILLILLEDGDVQDAGTLSAALEVAALGSGDSRYLERDAGDELPSICIGAFLLDRIRHLHLEDAVSDRDLVLSRSRKVSELLRETAPKLSLFLEKGAERIERLRIGESKRS